ncbi:MAG: 3D domain-containing protein [Phycisphaeraceae bacterium]|nr:3D domain-containing protein [Phycisphaeraceae bacterium]
MKTRTDVRTLSPWRVQGWRIALRFGISAAAAVSLLGLTAYSAVLAKEARSAQPLAAIEVINADAPSGPLPSQQRAESPQKNQVSDDRATDRRAEAHPATKIFPAGTRFFDGRPVRAARTIEMVVTAYSPDGRSCGSFADGMTATLHHVSTNGTKLVAADPKLLPYGALLTIPGYDAGNVVPVLDCGGAIKGNRLDVLFPTHEEARKWGVRKIKVTVWDYADGLPRENPRKKR